ncbi:hypothetical protein K1719_002376 [Acacia pycnantha]|nr:hypothetical protein K1719_002376 [Acacia pycnantha]
MGRVIHFEAEYVAASSCCAQVLWLKQQLCDLGVHLKEIPILCDNTSTISLAKNLFNILEPNILMSTSLHKRPCSKEGCQSHVHPNSLATR